MPLFKCYTNQAYYIKILAELLTHNLKIGCFELSDKSIDLTMFDHHRKFLVDIKLLADNFSMYKYKFSDKKFCMGLNMNHFHRMLRSIKKKDSLQLIISKKNKNELSIKTIPKENNRVTTSGIKIQEIQNLHIEIPYGYTKPIIVPSSEFAKMCKDLNSIGSSTITVIAKQFCIEFQASADGILTRNVSFGEKQLNDSDSDSDEEDIHESYVATFHTEQLNRLSKLAGLGTIIQIYPGQTNLPLLLRSEIGSLGKISIFLKSNELIAEEIRNYKNNSGSELESSSSDED